MVCEILLSPRCTLVFDEFRFAQIEDRDITVARRLLMGIPATHRLLQVLPLSLL